MKLRIVLAATAALVLGACGKSGNTEPAATASESAAPTATEASAAATPAAAPAAGTVPSKEYVVGKWAEGGDCGMAIQFNADGSMVGPFDKWELDKGVLTMVGNPQKMHLSVIDPDTMESRLDGSGAPRKLTRCK
ncbi:MAG: hypothetical protein JF595_13470 [Sphingomonadales bacterium]|nr:hypothetical protein [Sphingomonadales bacterium]